MLLWSRKSTNLNFIFVLIVVAQQIYCMNNYVTLSRETRDGWPLPTVETEANEDSKNTNERGPPLVGSLGSSCDFCPALVAPVGPVQNIFFLTVHYDNLFFPIAQQPRQSCRIACLLMCVSDSALHTAPNKFMTLLQM